MGNASGASAAHIVSGAVTEDVYVDAADPSTLEASWQARRAGKAKCASDGAPLALCVPDEHMGAQVVYRLGCPQCLRTSPWFRLIDGAPEPRSAETVPCPTVCDL